MNFRRFVPHNVGVGIVTFGMGILAAGLIAYGIAEKEYLIAATGTAPAWVAGIGTTVTYRMNLGEDYHN